MIGPLSVIVPVYNEAGNLSPLHDALVSALDAAQVEFEVLYVDDGSSDGSTEELRGIVAADPRARVIRFVRNYGQTAALSAGFRHARHPLLATMDADLQNDPADIPAMLKLLNEGHDVVCGWRADRKDPAISRRLPSWLANRLIAWLSRVDLHDYGCTLRVYRREYVKGVPLYGEMHRFIPIYVTWAGAKVVELPVRHHARTRGVSKYGLSRVPKVLLDLTTVKFLRDFYVTPIYFFGWAGFAGLILGGAAWLGAIITYVAFDAPLVVLALALLGPILALFGVIEITLGIIAEVLIRMHYDIRDKAPYRIRSVWNLETAEEVVSPGEAV